MNHGAQISFRGRGQSYARGLSCIALLCGLQGTVGCSTGDRTTLIAAATPAEQPIGELLIPLITEGQSGQRYQLEEGRLLLVSEDAAAEVVGLGSSDRPVRHPLAPGTYDVELLSGWRLRHLESGELVRAELESDNPRAVVVEANSTTPLPLSFRAFGASPPGADAGAGGAIEVSVSVEDRVDGGAGSPICEDLGGGSICADAFVALAVDEALSGLDACFPTLATLGYEICAGRACDDGREGCQLPPLEGVASANLQQARSVLAVANASLGETPIPVTGPNGLNCVLSVSASLPNLEVGVAVDAELANDGTFGLSLSPLERVTPSVAVETAAQECEFLVAQAQTVVATQLDTVLRPLLQQELESLLGGAQCDLCLNEQCAVACRLAQPGG